MHSLVNHLSQNSLAMRVISSLLVHFISQLCHILYYSTVSSHRFIRWSTIRHKVVLRCVSSAAFWYTLLVNYIVLCITQLCYIHQLDLYIIIHTHTHTCMQRLYPNYIETAINTGDIHTYIQTLIHTYTHIHIQL